METPPYAEVIEFWFADRAQTEPTVDSRLGCWFGNDAAFDAALGERFGDLVEQALAGRLDDWAGDPTGRLALILLLEQFPRHIWRDDRKAFRGDRKAFKLCEEGVANEHYRSLTALQQLFYFMPLQRMESVRVQQTSVRIFTALARGVSETMRDTFDTVAQFAELRRDIVAEFGRFPHRNAPLGRSNTGDEDSYLSA